MSELEQRIKDRIATLIQQRDNFVSEANREIAAMSGAIGELEKLLKPEAESAAEPGEQKQE